MVTNEFLQGGVRRIGFAHGGCFPLPSSVRRGSEWGLRRTTAMAGSAIRIGEEVGNVTSV